jgi:hypothetical protein
MSTSGEYCLVWRHDTANAAVSELVDVVRELRDNGAVAPPELDESSDQRNSAAR